MQTQKRRFVLCVGILSFITAAAKIRMTDDPPTDDRPALALDPRYREEPPPYPVPIVIQAREEHLAAGSIVLYDHHTLFDGATFAFTPPFIRTNPKKQPEIKTRPPPVRGSLFI